MATVIAMVGFISGRNQLLIILVVNSVGLALEVAMVSRSLYVSN